MLNTFATRIVDFCTRYAWTVVAATTIVGLGAAGYTVRNFAIDTDITNLLSSDLPWRQRELAYKAAFPHHAQVILAVVKGPTPELAEAAASSLTARLSKERVLFRSVRELGGGDFFERNRLLYLTTSELEQTTQRLAKAAPLIRILSADPSLRGLAQTLSASLGGLQSGAYTLDDMTNPLRLIADTTEDVLSRRTTTFSWYVLVNGGPVDQEDLRRLIEVWPALDYQALEPGAAATAEIRNAAKQVKLDSAFMSTLRLTGPVPIADHEFATLREGAILNGILTGAIVLAILWLALRSVRIVASVAVTVLISLTITAATGLMLVGALNPISAAFAVLCVGLGADFAIQFSIRYRAERHIRHDLHESLVHAAARVGAPLTLAAAAAAAGFFSFLPTDYRGLAELGLIAGCGMVIALAVSLTLLPALLRVVRPPPETERLDWRALAPIDRFLQRHRTAVVAGTSIAALAGLPLLLHLHFDFNPVSLRDPSSEPIATLRLLKNDSRVGINTAEVVAAQPDAASIARRLAALPEVARVRTLESLIPDDQDRKLELIGSAASALQPALAITKRAAPSDAENVTALRGAARRLREVAGESTGPGAQVAMGLAEDLERLAAADAGLRRTAEATFVRPLEIVLADLRSSLDPQRIVQSDLPRELVQDWVAPDGRVRIEAVPRGDTSDSETLQRFARAILAAQPTATGQAIEIYEWGRTIVVAFAQAGAWATCSIAILLWMALWRIRDVFLTLIPLLVAAVATLEICAAMGFALNYANIIALPVLLGVGVAFKIYYVMAWRAGETDFLQSILTRAVVFSGLMTATAFGSLWLSSHPGTSSMGKLLALSLVCTLASAALFQPALMGRPRKAKVGR